MVADLDGAGRSLPPGAPPSAERRVRNLPRSARRHRVRRALVALRLSEGQAYAARELKGLLDSVLETRRRLEDSRRALRHELSRPAPDAGRLSELLLHERRFEHGARLAWARVERQLAALLTPTQFVRLHALPAEVLGDTLARLTASSSRSRPPLA